ncbi:hypothetical protein ACHAXS_007723 [Conticribra weissflogii]
MADTDTNNPAADEPLKSANTEVIRSRKDRPTGSTHFGDVDYEDENPDEIEDATWGEVCRTCCCHDAKTWGIIFIGACAASFFLYFFLIALELLGSSAKVLTGCAAGGLFGDNFNPIAGLVIGELCTALLQSSSTTTSIIVSLVGAQAVSVKSAIYMVMGANIGTSVTNTIVAMGQMGDGLQLERAFAGATVHDFFNLLSVLVLLPLEAITHYLFYLTKAMLPSETKSGETWEGPIKAIVSPVTDRIIKSNKNIITDIATGKVADCSYYYPALCIDGIEDYKHCHAKCEEEGDKVGVDCGRVGLIACDKKVGCPAFFQHGATKQDDTISGGVCLFLSIVLLVICLTGLVNVLQRGLKGMSTRIIFKATNVNPLAAMIIGAAITMLVQSSSITTSVLTPLVGIGVVRLEQTFSHVVANSNLSPLPSQLSPATTSTQMFPLTLGANLGTTVTGLLAAAVADSADALQVALCHLFFNVSGIIIWYPLPFMRRVPMNAARAMGRWTRRSKSVPPIYIAMVFFVIPIALLGISTLFTQKKIGYTILGTFLVIFIAYAIGKFVFWWKRLDGYNKTMAYLDRREMKNKCMKTLPEDMLELKEDMSQMKSRMAQIVEYTGVPLDEEEMEVEKPMQDEETVKPEGDASTES